jgi:hypothetical protein
LLKRIPRGALAFVIDKGEGLPLVIADAEAVRDFVRGRWVLDLEPKASDEAPPRFRQNLL